MPSRLPATSPPDAPLLLAAVSARALAASAQRGGIACAALDMFGDLDTRRAAACATVPLRRGGFAARSLLAAAGALCGEGGCAGVVYGSGFEGQPQLLARLARGRTLWGNAPEVVAAVRDPLRFFPLLDELAIPHPEVRLQRPAAAAGWLAKRPGGAGGFHVRHLDAGGRLPRDAYFQRFLSGIACSALFLADGRNAEVVGFNEQWHAAPGSFGYGGAVGAAALSAAAAAAATGAVQRLTAALGLKGLNGLDFLVAGDAIAVLELNPRPTATLDLHDADFPRGLLAAHLQACRGALPRLRRAARPVRAHAVVYAPATGWIAPQGEWPAWCSDLPAPGTVIGGGEPVCTVHAHAASAAAARARCMARRNAIERTLTKAAA